jgi:hypothetical protein
VNDISLNAVANLGYAEFRWGVPVFPGDTLSVSSTVLGLRENSNRQSGVVWVRSVGLNQRAETVLDYVRWVMVSKRDPAARVGAPVVPTTAASVAPADLIVPPLSMMGYDDEAAGSPHRWEDYAPGERIDHVSGMTLEDSDHMFSTRRRSRRLAASLGGLRARRAHRPCQRHDARGLRPHVLDAALPEHRARPFRCPCRQEHPLRPAPGVWRPCDLAGTRAQLQRAGERIPPCGHQRR